MNINSAKKSVPYFRRLLNTPVCIICARSSEAEEIANALNFSERVHGHQISNISSGHTFYLGSFKLDDGSDLGCYVTHATRQGIQSFTVDASILFYLLKPRHVVHAGVCAGYNSPDGLYKYVLSFVQLSFKR